MSDGGGAENRSGWLPRRAWTRVVDHLRELWRPLGKAAAWVHLGGESRIFFLIVVMVLLAANLAPLVVTKYLPFSDLMGHQGLLGALAHRGDPEARIDEYFTIDIRLLPSILYAAFVAVLSEVLSVPVASNLFLAIFCITAVPLAMIYALRSFGKDERLVVLVFPLLYHRCIWFGFVNYVACIPLIVVSLAVLNRVLQDDPPLPWVRLRRLLALAVCAVLIVAAHAFGALAFFGLATLLLVASWRRPLAVARAVAAVVPALWYLGRWVLQFTGGKGGSSTVQEILGAAHSIKGDFTLFHGWTINGFAGRVDDWALLGLLVSLVGAAAWTIRHRETPAAREGLLWRYRTVILFLVALHAFFALPMEISHPPWWAVSVRFVPLAWLFAVLALPRATRRVPWRILAPAVLSGLLYGGYLTYDFRTWFRGVETAGLDEALDDIPRGVRVHALVPDFENERHYRHSPFGHVVTSYVVRRGGYAVPMMDGTSEVWVRTRPRPPFAFWGLARHFSWSAHGRFWDYFLVKDPPPGQPPLPPLFRDAPQGAVALVSRHGLWRVYRRVTEAPPTSTP